MNIVVSIIVPVYKTEKYLSDCIESILNQTFTDFELILVDDGSPDNSGVIADRYACEDNRISVIHKQNEGVSKARNIGLQKAQGDWVMFVDSDDKLSPDYLASLVASNTELREDCLAVSGALCMDRTTGICLWKQQFPKMRMEIGSMSSLEEFDVLDRILVFGTILGKLYSLHVIRNNSLTFCSELSLNEDQLFFFNYLQCISHVVSNSNIGYYYMINIGFSLSTHSHPYQERVRAYELLRTAYFELMCVWQYDAHNFEMASSFVCRVFLDALINAYRQSVPWQKRMNLLAKCNKKEIKAYYKPLTKYGRLFKHLIVLPNIIIDLILKLFIK
jgi:glycosyltransferase involved in cell wall biosynthesis